MIENSLYYAPPYLPVYGYVDQIKLSSLKSLTVMEWDDKLIKEEFIKYVNSEFGFDKASELIDNVDKFIHRDI